MSSIQRSPEAAGRVAVAVDTVPIVLFEFDSNGTYTCVGGGMIQLFGITPERMVGRSVFDWPRFVPGKNMMVRRALRGESVSFTGIWPRGRYMIRLEPRRDADGRVTAVVGLGHDVIKPKASDGYLEELLEALRQSEARFRAMCESAPLGIYVCNARFELAYANPAICSLLGRRSDELQGRRWETALHSEERAQLRGISAGDMHHALEAGRTARLLRADGTTVWAALRAAAMRDDGELVGYVGTLVDITQERAARLAMDRAQQDLRRVIESSPEGIAVVRDERWIFINRALSDALGHPPQSLMGRIAAEIVHPEDRPRALALMRRRGSSPADDVPVELRCQRASGEYSWLEVRPAALTEFEGAPALLLNARDITERKRLHAQLLLSERLVSMGTLAAGVAHEINNPIAAVLSSLDWVAAQLSRLDARLEQSSASELPRSALRSELMRLAKPIDDARDAAGRVRAITRDLKLFSRVEDEVQGPVDLAQVLDSSVRMAWHELRHRARLLRDYGELPLVHGSEARLSQVFLNLLINAAQSIPEASHGEHQITLCARGTPARQVIVEVRDTGCGIPAHLLGRIFDPFFTTKPAGVGSGLGLSICQRLLTSMGGQIEVESEPERGSVFRVTLCESDAQLVAAAAERISVTELAKARGRVLVIDDDPAMASAIELLLADEHDVTAFSSARRALSQLEAGECFDAIVCDVMMPEMSGMDFHDALSQLSPGVASQVIFLTGGAFSASAREFLQRVENPCLDKPFESQRLRALVRRQVARAGFNA